MARPVHVLECAFASDPDAALSSQVWTDISAYLDVQAGVRITRGRPDEFSTIQPGTMALTLKNVDGRFTMANPASPYAPNVVPGKKIRYGLMWPGGGKNYALNTSTAPGLLAFWSPGGTVPPTLSESTAGPPVVGTHGLQIAWGVGGSTPNAGMTISGLVIGRQYTVSAQARTPSSGSGPFLLLGIAGILDGAPNTLLDTWQQIKVTFTATANTHILRVRPATSPTGGTGRINAIQVEEGPVVTSFVNTAGTFAWRFTGDVNEWPLGWAGGGAFYAETQLTASDRLAKLGDLGEFQTLLVESGLHLSPVAFFPLGEEPAATSAADVSANGQPAATPVQVGSGGSIQFGSDVYTVAGTDFPSQPPFYAQSGTGAWFSPVPAGGLFLRSILNAPTTGPGASVVMFANAGGGTPVTGTLASMQAAEGSYVSLERDGSFQIIGVFYDAATSTRRTVTIAPGFPGHQQFAVTLTNLGTGNWRLDGYLQGVLAATLTFAITRPMPSWTVVSIGGRTKDAFAVIASHAQFYDYAVNPVDLLVQSYAGLLGQTGASEGTTDRLANLKAFAGLDTMFILGSAAPKTAGPGEIAGNPIDALNKVADTEGGLFLIRTDGYSTFHLSDYRYNVSPSMTLGADKLDPNALTFRGDTFGVVNDVTATGSTGLSGRAVNTASRAAHGLRKGSVDTLGVTVSALFSSAAREAYGFGTARNRITGVRVSLLNQPALIATALGLDIGEKLAVTGLPAQAPASSVELFVEGYAEAVSEDDWSVTYNTSPAEPWNVWQLGVAGRSELGSTTILAY